MKKYNYLTSLLIALLFLSACEKSQETNREQDEQTLAQLFTELKTLAESSTCTNATKLNYKPVGEKACGGSTTYLVYSSTIDTVKLIAKISTYTKKQSDYNKKYGISSDCMFVMPPKSISCQNGKPVAIY